MELIFVAAALMLFFSGVACLKKRTNEYLFNLYRQQIASSTSEANGAINNTDSPFSSSTNLNYQSEIFFDDDSESQENFLPGRNQCHPMSPCLFHHNPSASSGAGGRGHSAGG